MNWNTNHRIVIDKHNHHVMVCISEPNLEAALCALKIKSQIDYLLNL